MQESKPTIIDKIIKYTILWAIPKFITPNQVTIFRFITIPFIMYFLLLEEYKILIPLFTISALSDAIDGAMARTRDQITDFGKIIDPIADKLLIVSCAIIVVSKFIDPLMTALIIFSEIMIVLGAIYHLKVSGQKIEAKLAGKLKMIFQSFGVGFLILHGAYLGIPIIFLVAQILILISVLFALLSIFVYKTI